MKIVQVCPRYYPDIGGVETFVQEISERLVKCGFELEVVCTDPSGQLPKNEIINEVTITRFRSFSPGDAYYFAPQIYFYLKNHSYDLIHAHSYHAFPALFAAFAKDKCRFIFTPYYHGGGHTALRNLLHKPYKSLGRKIFEKADRLTCISEYERRRIVADFDVPSSKIEKIPIGLNTEEFEEIKHNIEYISEKNNRSKTLLYVGRLEEYKGVHHIIKALPHLKGFKLKIIGKGPYEKSLYKLAEELSITEQIIWYKNISREELLKQYLLADVFLMLSTRESYGITVAEALASGVPCIVAIGSALEEFVDGKTCVGLSYPIDIDNLANTIKSISYRHANTIKNTMDWNEVVKRLIKVYEDK